MPKHLANLGRIVRFQLVAWVGAVVQMGVLWFLRQVCELPLMAALICAVEIALIHNFTGHYFITWRGRVKRSWSDYLARLVVYNVTTIPIDLIANVGVVLALTRLGTDYRVAAPCGLIFGPVLKYVVNDLIIFKNRVGTRSFAPVDGGPDDRQS